MLNRLKTSTALIASLSLLAPGPIYAQDTTEPAPEVPMVCADGSDQPCPEGVPLVPAPDAVMPEEMAPAEEVAPAEAAPEAAPEAPAEAAPEAAPVEEPAPAEQSAVDPAPAEEPAPAEATEAAPVTEESAPETVTETAPETSPAPEPAPETATETVPAEEPAATEAKTEPTPVEDPAATDQPAEAQATEPADTTPETAPAETVAQEPVPELPVQPDAASGEAPVAAAASADATAEAPAGAEVTEEVVTEDTARSSSEDFANKVNETAADIAQETTTSQTAAAPAKKDKGLSDGEKAILLGLGAVAVGAMLSNNRKVELNSGDRVVLERPDGSYQIIKDDNALLRQPGSTVRTERFDDGSTRTTVTRADESRIVTIRDAEYRVLRRIHVAPDGTQTMLFDDTVAAAPVDVTRLPPPAPEVEVSASADEEALRRALARESAFDRHFSLAQIRDIQQVRALVPVIDLNAITFETGSAAIRPDQAPALSRLGNLMKSYIDANPREVFLIEGHTDAVGSAAYNLALSDRRAESVALAMTEYFAVPPENMVVQGYGESFLKVQTDAAEQMNRRASVRRITDLLRQAAN